MILRPVRPASPIGPPISNRPVGFTSSRKPEVSMSSPSTTGLDDVVGDVGLRAGSPARRPRRAGWRRPRCRARTARSPSYSIVTWVLPSGRRYGHRRRSCGPRTAAGRAGARARSAAASARGVVAGVAEHQALVAGALQVQRVARRPRPRALVRVVDALGDVRRLRADRDADTPQELPSKPLLRGVVADAEDRSRGRSPGCRRTPAVVTSPATWTRPVVTMVSTATRLRGSSAQQRVEDRRR